MFAYFERNETRIAYRLGQIDDLLEQYPDALCKRHATAKSPSAAPLDKPHE